MRLSLEEIYKILTESPAEVFNDKTYLLMLFDNMKYLYLQSEGADPSHVPTMRIDKIEDILFDFLILMVPGFQPKMYSQSWFIDRMRALGYKADQAGMCYGLSSMAMQAFLAHDMDTFNQRLQRIYDTPLDRFKSEALRSTGEMVDILAFFDGIVLNHDPESYLNLFSDDKKICLQYVEKTMSRTLPLALDTPEKKPEKIGALMGAYGTNMLTSYLSLLQEHLGHGSFSLILISEGHAINLNYDSSTGRWLLVDPNNLPGVEYTHPDLLAEALMFDYKSNMLLMETDIFTSSESAQTLHENFNKLVELPSWKEIHPLIWGGMDVYYMQQWLFAIRSRDKAWIEYQLRHYLYSPGELDVLALACRANDKDMVELILDKVMPSEEAFRWAIQNNNIELITLLMNKKCPTEASLVDAIERQDIQLMSHLMKHITPTELSLNTGMYTNNMEILLLLMAHVNPTKSMLAAAVEHDLMIAVYLFIQRVEPTEKIIKEAMWNYYLNEHSHKGNIDLIKLLLDHFDPTQETLKHACCHPEVLTLVMKKVKPTEETLRYAVEEGWVQSHPEVLTMLKEQMNSTLLHDIAVKTQRFFKHEKKKKVDDAPSSVDTPSKRQ